jgi:serine/threonine protein phosphatase PrpC
VKGPEKTRNGDHALIRETGTGETHEGTASEATVILAVADGVGSRPCDWRASEVACSSAVEGIQEATQEASGSLEGQIEAGIRKAHWKISRETGRCEGMLAAIVVAAWPQGSDEVVFAGVGDARIYQVHPGRAQQLTEDDKKTKTIRQDTRTSLPGAPSTIRRDVLTQALGGEYKLDLDARRASFSPGAGLALASDGAYPLGGFESKLRRTFGQLDLQETLGE